MRVDDSSPRSRRSNCNGRSVWGGLKSTPITEKSPSSGSSREPRFPAMPVTTTTGLALAISSASTVAAVAPGDARAHSQLVAHPVAAQPGARDDAGTSADAYAEAAAPPLGVRNMPHWEPPGTCTY